MIFSELYSAYYTTVARILETALQGDVTEKKLQQQVVQNAFSESILTILPALKSNRWPLLKKDLTPVVEHIPTMPLTLLQKQWLKAICEDPRIRLFGEALPDLADVEPLFTREDYRIFDQYSDGDPYEDESYIRHFRLIRDAIRHRSPIRIVLPGRAGGEAWIRLIPTGLEYSMKDDKIRILAEGCKFRQFNLGRVLRCADYTGPGPWTQHPPEPRTKELTLRITDWRNTMERALLHFAHFEKQAERLEGNQSLLHLKYDESDETEMVIRILSFGPLVQVLAPDALAQLVRDRLKKQMAWQLR